MIKTEKKNEFIVITIEGSILQNESNLLKKKLEKLLEDNEKNIVIDMSETNHVCSSALGHLVYYRNKIKRESGDIRLVIVDDDLLELFDITMLNQVFMIFPNQIKALESFA
ncbi:MAG: STAS domain-containing protein [Leptospiraceae bacterium]|nr:STAS domain-containing protein [Leptospiraceae bacterium]